MEVHIMGLGMFAAFSGFSFGLTPKPTAVFEGEACLDFMPMQDMGPPIFQDVHWTKPT